jgi:hypothetical protein
MLGDECEQGKLERLILCMVFDGLEADDQGSRHAAGYAKGNADA